MRRRTLSTVAAEDDEASDAEVERIGDGAGLVPEPSILLASAAPGG